MAEPLEVLKVESGVEYRSGSSADWKMLDAGSQLDLPVEIRTRRGASVVLEQAGSTFTMKPETRLGFAGAGARGDGLVSRVKHWIGTAFYRIERQPDTLSVETPFLVSTIKGTEFVIVSTEQESFVTLTEGSLQVLDLATGKKMMIVPGEVTGSSAGASSVRTYQPNKTAPSTVKRAEPMDGSDRFGKGERMSPPVRLETPGPGGNSGGLGQRGNGFEKALQAIDEVRIDQRENAERREARQGDNVLVNGRPAQPGDGGRPGGRDNGGSPGGGSGPAPGPGAGSGNNVPGSGPVNGGGNDGEDG